MATHQPKSQISDQALQEALVAEGMVAQEVIDQLLENKRRGFSQQQKALGGILYQVDPRAGLRLVREA